MMTSERIMDPVLVRAREDFPILTRTVYGKPLIYLDNAATTHKPQCVIDALSGYYATTNSNVHAFSKPSHTSRPRMTRPDTMAVDFVEGSGDSDGSPPPTISSWRRRW